MKSFSSLPGGEDAEVNGPAPDDVEAYIQLGFAALQRYFESGTLVRNPDYETAESFLGSALGLLRADDPLRVDVSFALGAIRIAEHETRCARPCPAPEEVAPIVALLAPGGSMDDAPPDRLYPYALAGGCRWPRWLAAPIRAICGPGRPSPITAGEYPTRWEADRKHPRSSIRSAPPDPLAPKKLGR